MSRRHGSEQHEAVAPPGVIRVGAGTVRPRGAASAARVRASVTERPSRYGKWRALTLGSIYLLFGLHIAHWKLRGTTLAPLELNEVMYTLEAGVVTAGFLLMATLFVATAFVGRFFCSWACHIMALEDLCAWLLGKLRIRPKKIRSRLLLLVPPLALFYMFVWPQILRVMEGRPLPEFRILTDQDGWASFVTTDFWRNLPDPWIAGLTFAVCGFAIIYVLGSRSFCFYACPYGAVFAAVDRVAPGRIMLKGHCEQCGTCTAVCSSSVRVHEEIATFGKVVDVNCMKDLDCVSACPQEAIGFGFTSPALGKSFSRTGRRRLRSDLSTAEELQAGLVFVATLLVFRGLYAAVPFLMTLGLAGIAAWLSVLCVRLVRKPDVRFVPFRLKTGGRLTAPGWTFAAAMCVGALFFAHSAVIRYHEFRGQNAFDEVKLALAGPTGAAPAAAVHAALGHLRFVRDWGLFKPALRDEQLASLYLKSDEPARAEGYLRTILDRKPEDDDSRLALARILVQSGRADEALQMAPMLGAGGTDAAPFVTLGELLADAGRLGEAATYFRRATSIQPELAAAHYNLGVVLAAAGDAGGAIAAYRACLDRAPDDADALNNLGFLLAAGGDLDAAGELFERAVAVRPDFAHAHFNLGRVYQARSRLDLADRHYREAARLDPNYAALFQ